MSFAAPANEGGRLEALRRYRILDTAPEAAYDEITELAAQICGCPVAVIGFVDEAQDWKKSKYGLPANFTGLPREISICSTTICAGNLLHVGDLTKDERFRENATVTGPPHLRFYCGMPLVTPDGYALGTLCVIDFQPREISFEQGETVRRLARQVVTQLELRRRVIELDQTLAELRESRTAITEAKLNSEELLLNILPAAIAEELKQHGKVIPRHHDAVTILFADFKGIWGDAVNIASLLETNGAPGRVTVSESTHHRVKELFVTEPRGTIEAKNKGQLAMFFVDRIKPEFSADADGRVPNERFQSRRSGVVAASQWPTNPAATS